MAATMSSEYKHNYTLKVVVAITPNGAICYVSPTYGGQATDVIIVRGSRFFSPYTTI